MLVASLVCGIPPPASTGTQKYVHLKCLKLWQKHALMDVVGSNRSAKDRAYRCSVCNSKFSIRLKKGASPLPHSPPLCGNSCVLVLRLSVRRERGYSASYATFIIYHWRARVLAWECPCSLFLSHCRSRLQHRRRPSVFVCLCVCVSVSLAQGGISRGTSCGALSSCC